MGHSQLETTRSYLDEIGIDDLADALGRAAAARKAQASADQETEMVEAPEASKRCSGGGGFERREDPHSQAVGRISCIRSATHSLEMTR